MLKGLDQKIEDAIKKALGTKHVRNMLDENGNPAGGYYHDRGITITWQDGPLGRGEDRQEPNGAFVENVIQAAISRLEFYQGTKFKCLENQLALDALYKAMVELGDRIQRREKAGTEGTHATDRIPEDRTYAATDPTPDWHSPDVPK